MLVKIQLIDTTYQNEVLGGVLRTGGRCGGWDRLEQSDHGMEEFSNLGEAGLQPWASRAWPSNC